MTGRVKVYNLQEIQCIPILKLDDVEEVPQPKKADEPFNYCKFYTHRAHLNYRPLSEKMDPESMTQVPMNEELWQIIYSDRCDEIKRRKKIKKSTGIKSFSPIKLHHAVQSVIRGEFGPEEAAKHFGVPTRAIRDKLKLRRLDQKLCSEN